MFRVLRGRRRGGADRHFGHEASGAVRRRNSGASVVRKESGDRSPAEQMLMPTLAIELAPPAVAGVAYFAINGDRLEAGPPAGRLRIADGPTPASQRGKRQLLLQQQPRRATAC